MLLVGGCRFGADGSETTESPAGPIGAAVRDYAVREGLGDSGPGPQAIESVRCTPSRFVFEGERIFYCDLRWRDFGIKACAVVVEGRLVTEVEASRMPCPYRNLSRPARLS